MEGMTGTHNGPEALRSKGDSAPTTDRLAAKAHETIEKVAHGSADAEHLVREKASDAASKMRETEARAKQAADRSAAQLADYVQENPLLSAGIAFAAGIVVSSLLRR